MPRIDDQFLDCAAYLYPTVDAAAAGRQIGGSGFLIAVPHRNTGKKFTVCVTNRHVVELGNPIIRLNNKSGGGSIAELCELDWFYHSDNIDLAACIVPAFPMGARYTRIAYEALVTKEKVEEFDIGPGDEIFLIGRFINHDGGQENVPTVRFGNIAQSPVALLYDENGRGQPSYLIEARSIGGYSGSPVFAYIPPFVERPKQEGISGECFGPALLGVDWCHTFYAEPLLDSSARDMGYGTHVRSHSGLMGVIPAWLLKELLDDERLQNHFESGKKVKCYQMERVIQPDPLHV